MKNKRFPLFAILLLCSCATQNRYEGHGIAFEYPEDWTVSQEYLPDEDGFFIQADDPGGNSADMILIDGIRWFGEGESCEAEAREYLRVITTGLSENEDYKDLVIEEIPDATLNGYPACGVSYRYRWFGSLNYGEAYTFCHDARIVSVTLSETLINGTTRDGKAFRLLKESFQLH